jgi:WS/DGAT/MGAT family acyltransferase
MDEERPATMRRLTGQDAVFVYAELPSMGMHTMGTLLIDPPDRSDRSFGYEEVVGTIAARIHLMPPLRQRLLEIPLDLGNPVFVDDPDFRIENHMHRIGVPQPGTLHELAEIVGDIASRPLPRTQPLWEMWVAEGMAEGRMALVMKLHHAILDGATGSGLMATLMDVTPDAEPPKPPSELWSPPPLPSAFELTRRSLTERFVDPIGLGRLVWKTGVGIRNRQRAIDEVTPEGEERAGLFEGGPMTRMNGSVTARRSAAYGSAPLEEIKIIKNAYGVTVNDAILAATTLAMRRYLQAQDDLPDVPIYCLVPVSTKSDDEKQDLSNKVSGMVISMPTQLEDPDEIVEAIRAETANAKHVFGAIEDDLLPAWLDVVPPAVVGAIARVYGGFELADSMQRPMANVVVSNMMGPPIPLYFGGARVEAVYPMGPVAHGMGLNITLLSNMGRIDIGVLACPDNVTDVWSIAEGFARAVGELKVAAEKLRDQQDASSVG